MRSNEELYTRIDYIPIRHRIWPDADGVTVYVYGSIPAEYQLTMFDRLWVTVVDDNLTLDDIPEDTHIIELDDIATYHPDCLRRNER